MLGFHTHTSLRGSFFSNELSTASFHINQPETSHLNMNCAKNASNLKSSSSIQLHVCLCPYLRRCCTPSFSLSPLQRLRFFECFILSRSNVCQLAPRLDVCTRAFFHSLLSGGFRPQLCMDWRMPPSPTVDSIVEQRRCFYGLFLYKAVNMRCGGIEDEGRRREMFSLYHLEMQFST